MNGSRGMIGAVGQKRPEENRRKTRLGSLRDHSPLNDVVAVLCAVVWILGFASVLPCDAQAQALTIEETEELVRTLHYEGLPEDHVRQIDAAGAAHLAEMLVDSAESRAHANILMAIGQCGEPGAYEAIAAWVENMPEGEIDRDTFRAWQVLPFALGNLAEHDPRALTLLEQKLGEASPAWTFRKHRGAKLHRLQRRAAASALAKTGLPEAAAALDRAADQVSDSAFEEHLREARSLHQERSKRSETR